jgi:hypothetical protein
MMNVALVAGQRHPQIKNITQKNQVLIIFFQGLHHPEKNCMVPGSFAKVGVGDDDHMICLMCRSQVQGSTFRVKDKEGLKDPKFSLKMLISQIIANLAPNFGLSLTKLTHFL